MLSNLINYFRRTTEIPQSPATQPVPVRAMRLNKSGPRHSLRYPNEPEFVNQLNVAVNRSGTSKNQWIIEAIRQRLARSGRAIQ